MKNIEETRILSNIPNEVIKETQLDAVPTPVLDGLISSEAYGTLSPKKIKSDIYETLVRMNKESKVFIIMGEPESGKTTLASEIIATATKIAPHDSTLSPIRIRNIDFEDAQIEASKNGYSRDRDEFSHSTISHYQKSNVVFNDAICDSIVPGSLLVIHAPAMIERGNLDDLAKHTGIFKGKNYDLNFIFMIKGRGIEARANRVREGFKQDPDSKDKFLIMEGVEVQLEKGTTSTIRGGNTDAVNRFYKSEAKFLFEMAKKMGLSEIKTPDYFQSVTRRAQFLEFHYAPWLLRNQYRIPENKVLIGKNNPTIFATQYQDEINSTSYFQSPTPVDLKGLKWY